MKTLTRLTRETKQPNFKLTGFNQPNFKLTSSVTLREEVRVLYDSQAQVQEIIAQAVDVIRADVEYTGQTPVFVIKESKAKIEPEGPEPKGSVYVRPIESMNCPKLYFLRSLIPDSYNHPRRTIKWNKHLTQDMK